LPILGAIQFHKQVSDSDRAAKKPIFGWKKNQAEGGQLDVFGMRVALAVC